MAPQRIAFIVAIALLCTLCVAFTVHERLQVKQGFNYSEKTRESFGKIERIIIRKEKNSLS